MLDAEYLLNHYMNFTRYLDSPSLIGQLEDMNGSEYAHFDLMNSLKKADACKNDAG